MREMKLLIFLKKEFFHPYKGNVFKTEETEESEEQSEEESEELDENKFFKDIENESEGINYDLFEKHFMYSTPTVLAK